MMAESREKDESSIQLLKELQEQVHSTNASVRRRAAYNLAWLQEDGLETLKKLLFSNLPLPTKNAAAYGLRKMQGRMKKKAFEVLIQGLQENNHSTALVCSNALRLLGYNVPKELLPKNPTTKYRITNNNTRIREYSYNKKTRKTVDSRFNH